MITKVSFPAIHRSRVLRQTLFEVNDFRSKTVECFDCRQFFDPTTRRDKRFSRKYTTDVCILCIATI